MDWFCSQEPVNEEPEPSKEGAKRQKNITVSIEKDVSFNLPQGCDVSSFRDMDQVLPLLHGWEVECSRRCRSPALDTVNK